jgi:hypothetical protein
MPLLGLFIMRWRDYKASSRSDFRVDVVADITDAESSAIRRERKGERREKGSTSESHHVSQDVA